MNNKGFTIVEVIMALGTVVVLSGGLYFGYLIIRALQKYIGG
jgi:hypothetical protein